VLVTTLELVFPHTSYLPAPFAELTVDAAVAGLVAGDL
jgi:hypothetical protein